jgi:hypothetical protein
MSEVYGACDLEVQREVALKVLPDSFALDAERLARFQREGLVLATPNHPHVATIYLLEDSKNASDVRYADVAVRIACDKSSFELAPFDYAPAANGQRFFFELTSDGFVRHDVLMNCQYGMPSDR